MVFGVARRFPLAAMVAGGAAALLAIPVALLPTWPAPPWATRAAGATRTQVDLNSGWRFRRDDRPEAQSVAFDDAAWTPVSVPHTWNAIDGQDGGADYHRGAGWYRRHYTPPPDWAGKRLLLQFDGANTVTDVWVNGTHLGQHRGGYARFRFDATAAFTPGADNVVAVRVSNAFDPDVAPLDADYTFFGGLYRNVALLVTDPLAIDALDHGGPGVYVRQRRITPAAARIDVTVSVRNSSTRPRDMVVRAVVGDDDTGTVVRAVQPGKARRLVQPLDIPMPRLWQGRADPHLYSATVEVRDAVTGAVTDAVTVRFGLRTVSVKPDHGLFLNGRHLAVHGVSRHQDRLGKGWALADADTVQDFDLMDEMGVNALRTAHYQQEQKVYDLADERGYLVWTEVPLVNRVTDNPAFTANAEGQMRELIRQNFNHPSITFWGIGNEQDVDDPATNRLLGTLAGVVTAEDPDRFSTYAHASAVVDGQLTTHAYLTGYNRYYGWYYGIFDQLGAFLDAAHSKRPDVCIALSEYGAGGSVIQYEANPSRPEPAGAWHPEQYQALLHEQYWAQIRTREYLWGSFVWNMFDFAVDRRDEGDTPGRNDKGLVTYDRSTRKDAFYFYKAQWTSTPFVHITGGHWTERTDPVVPVKVYGTADTVTLTVNGVQVGPSVQLADHAYTWPQVALAPGVNTIEVTAGTYTDTVRWTLR
jgi:beta-galactosidase